MDGLFIFSLKFKHFNVPPKMFTWLRKVQGTHRSLKSQLPLGPTCRELAACREPACSPSDERMTETIKARENGIRIILGDGFGAVTPDAGGECEGQVLTLAGDGEKENPVQIC